MAIKTSWTAGEVLAAADLTDTLASKMSYALPTNAQTGSGASAYTFVLADANKLVTQSNASSATFTIPPQSSVAWAANTVLRLTNLGAGVVTIAAGAGVTVTNTAATVAQYGSVNLIRTASDAWTVVPFSGGSAKATVSGTTGSPTITTVGSQTCYKYTGSGTITTATDGLLTVLVVAGGGGSGARGDYLTPGGGGAGGYIYKTIFLTAGTYNITVGGGGAGGAAGNTDGTRGNPSLFAGIYAVGGGPSSSYGTNNVVPPGGSGAGGSNYGGPAAGAGGVQDQGNTGGTSATQSPGGNAGGGGGAGGAGGTPTAGPGISNSITGAAVTYATGGAGSGGSVSGSANTGQGATGGTTPSGGGSGGSGVVILLIG